MRIGYIIFRVMLAGVTNKHYNGFTLANLFSHIYIKVFLVSGEPPMHSSRDSDTFHLISLPISRASESSAFSWHMRKGSRKRHIHFPALPAGNTHYCFYLSSVMSHSITNCKGLWKYNLVVYPGRRGNGFSKWLSSHCCSVPTFPSPLHPLSLFSSPRLVCAYL